MLVHPYIRKAYSQQEICLGGVAKYGVNHTTPPQISCDGGAPIGERIAVITLGC